MAFVFITLCVFSLIVASQAIEVFLDANTLALDQKVHLSLSKDISNNWHIGDAYNFNFTVGIGVIQVIGKVDYISLMSGGIFLAGTVGFNEGTFSVSFFNKLAAANIYFQNNIQYELRPTTVSIIDGNALVIDDPFVTPYSFQKVNVTKDYFEKDGNTDGAIPIPNATTTIAPITSRHLRYISLDFATSFTTANVSQGQDLPLTTPLNVLILYTKEAVEAAGSESALIAQIVLGQGNFNLGLSNSNVAINVITVGIQRIKEYDTYIEPSASQMMNDLISGVIDTSRRYSLCADAIQLVVKNSEFCGLGFYSFNGVSSATYAVSVANYRCVGGYFSGAHEIGHNIGLHHDLSSYPNPGINHGYCWDLPTTTGCRRTIMAYPSCVTSTGRTNCDRVAFFSSPVVFDLGRPTGQSDCCNNAQQLRNNIQAFISLVPKDVCASTVQPSSSPPLTVIPSRAPSYNPSMTPSRSPLAVSPISTLPRGQCPPDATTGAIYGCSGCQFCRDGSVCNLCVSTPLRSPTKAPVSTLPPGQCPPDATTGAIYGCSGCQFCRDGSVCNLCAGESVTSSSPTKSPVPFLPPGQCPPDATTGAIYGCSGCQFCRDGSVCNLCNDDVAIPVIVTEPSITADDEKLSTIKNLLIEYYI